MNLLGRVDNCSPRLRASACPRHPGDACGFPIEFDLTGGEVHDCKAAPALIHKLPASEHIIADKGYDSIATRYDKLKRNYASMEN